MDMAKELSLGLDSFVFVDDNPAEREAVRRLCPEVTVVELPKDPATLCRLPAPRRRASSAMAS